MPRYAVKIMEETISTVYITAKNLEEADQKAMRAEWDSEPTFECIWARQIMDIEEED